MAEQIANEFVTFYYQTFDSGRQNLSPLYKAHSMLSFEGQQFQGPEAIVGKLISLPFQKVQHRVSTIDVQPGNPQNTSIVVFVTGQLLVDEESNPQFFSQTFQLIGENGNFYIFNDIFRLNLA